MSLTLACLLSFGALLLALRAAGRRVLAETLALNLLLILLLGQGTDDLFAGEVLSVRFVVGAGALLVTDRLLACTAFATR